MNCVVLYYMDGVELVFDGCYMFDDGMLVVLLFMLLCE